MELLPFFSVIIQIFPLQKQSPNYRSISDESSFGGLFHKEKAYFVTAGWPQSLLNDTFPFFARLDEVQEELLYFPCVGGGVGVSKMFKFYVEVN